MLSIDVIEPLANRIADLGWHVQLNMNREQMVEHAAMLRRLRIRIVFDHLAYLSAPEGLKHPAYAVVRSLIDKGRTPDEKIRNRILVQNPEALYGFAR